MTIPLFQKLRYRLLLSYLAVLAGILAVFAIAVRLVFLHSLIRHTFEELTILAKSAAGTAEFQNGQLSVGNEFSTKNLVPRDETLQWFDLQQRLIAQQGKNAVNLPLVSTHSVQEQRDSKFLAVTLPIIARDDRRLIGYVRASESLDTEDKALEKLDWGLGVGIVTALAMSAIGGVWLTRQAMQPAEQSFQQLKQFTADASHELRSPLMAIKSNAAVALKYAEGMRPVDAEKFAAIASAADQIAHLTDDLLLLARSDQTADLKLAAVHITEVLEELIAFYHPQADAKQIELIAKLVTDLSVWGNGVELRRVFANLIENALHYTPDEGRIIVQARPTHRCVEVSVQDTGIGIAPENLERVFDRFWRADQSRARWAGGSGLGLAIVLAIVQRHGGSITVTSTLGTGSCFTVQLPTSPARNTARMFQR